MVCSLQTSQNVGHFQQILDIFEVFVPHFYLDCTHCIIPENLLTHLNSLRRGMFKFKAKFDVDSSLYLLSHFECYSHTEHMLTQWRLLPSLTGTVKSSLFMHVPTLLAARLHRSCANCSHYINNWWTFSEQTSNIYTHTY